MREHKVYLYIKNLDNLYSYPSPIQLTFKHAGSNYGRDDYGILGLDGSLHNPDYYLPSYTG